ncbi:hypothetical protein [Pseudodesulfovibrio piezophilus]|uniref:YALI0F24673p n=1 Tax=Pseudodesulfovibrio piezophilus (strain DSM 21447 / JCM 15486 / C1TLV30) TaxID=1322246 RepID=M1WKE7_PSEP2
MREFWTFIGGVAVGILAVTGVFAMDEDDNPRSIETDEDEMEEVEDETEEETDDDGKLTVRAS